MALIECEPLTIWAVGFMIDDGKEDGYIKLAGLKSSEDDFANAEIIPIGCIKEWTILHAES